MIQGATSAGEGTVSGGSFWGGGFAEDEEFDKGANKYHDR